ncbi:hypothetical protein J3B02_004033 [Coemansia erecta]|nr:hypothetical protein J3B02_004033 [Coemansia erecta]
MQPEIISPASIASIKTHWDANLNQYSKWLASTQDLVVEVCHHVNNFLQSSGSTVLDRHTLAQVAKAMHSIGRLRICAHYSHTFLNNKSVDNQSSAVASWIEATYLAWLNVLHEAMRIGKSEAFHRLLSYYLLQSQNSDAVSSADQLYPVVGLVGSVIDIPTPKETKEIVGHMPIATFMDVYLDSVKNLNTY